MSEVERILLFGLSGDPPTGLGGHLGLVRWAAQRREHPEMGGAPRAIWIVPVYRHAFAEKSDLTGFEHRMAMCRLCFGDLGPGAMKVPVEVKPLERQLAAQNGKSRGSTLELIEDLEGRRPGARFGLLLGADTAEDLRAGRWQRGDEILSRIPLVVAPRRGTVSALDFAEDAPQLDEISSSAARAHANDPAALRRFVTDPVARYIEEIGLYGAGRRPSGV